MNITLLVGTCDKYNFLWKNFAILFDRYWDHNINIKKYFLSETLAFNDYGFDTLLPEKVPYSDCLKFALNCVDTKYILWMQDDYFLQKTVPRSKFDYYISIMNNGVDRFGIHEDSIYYDKFHVINTVYRLRQNSLYTISMQASIWNKEFFKSCLIQEGKENPWEFEVNGTNRLNNSRFHNIMFDKQQEPWYDEAMRKGSFTKSYYDILKKENLNDI
jgi:hypothetical protein